MLVPRSLPNTSSHWQGSLLCLCQMKYLEIKNLKKWCTECLIRWFLFRKRLNEGNSAQLPSGGPTQNLNLKKQDFFFLKLDKYAPGPQSEDLCFLREYLFFKWCLSSFCRSVYYMLILGKIGEQTKSIKENIKMIHNFQISPKFRSYYILMYICIFQYDY